MGKSVIPAWVNALSMCAAVAFESFMAHRHQPVPLRHSEMQRREPAKQRSLRNCVLGAIAPQPKTALGLNPPALRRPHRQGWWQQPIILVLGCRLPDDGSN